MSLFIKKNIRFRNEKTKNVALMQFDLYFHSFLAIENKMKECVKVK